MSRIKAGLVRLILVSFALCPSSIFAGCASAPVSEASALYTIALAGPGRQDLTVRARFTGMAPGPTDLVMLRQWAGCAGLDAQLSWMRVGASNGPDTTVNLSPAPLSGLEQDVVHWSVTVPKGGVVQIEYHVELSGRDGEVPSWVGAERALLLTRSLFVVPVSWLSQPRAPLQGLVRVQLSSPAGWPVYAPWPSSADGTAFLPTTVEDLFDAAIALGGYEAFELRDEAFRARVLLPRGIEGDYALRRATDLAQGMLSVYRLFGVAPGLGPNADLLAIVVTDDLAPGQAASAALADNLILAQARATLPPSLDEMVMREALRLWIAGAVRTAPRWTTDPDAREPLLTCGWAEYLAWQIRLSAGRLSPLQYWDHMRQAASAVAQSPVLDKLSLADATKWMRDDPVLARFVRDKGHLGALLLDQRLRADTGGKIDLAYVVRRIHQKHNYYATGALATREEVLGLLSELTGRDYSDFYTTLTHGLGPLDLSNTMELSGPPVGETRVLSTPDGLRLFYQWLDGPTGRAAIYLGGGPGRAPYDLMYLMAQPLQQYLDVAYLEQRGSGRSDGPGQGAYSMDAYINDIELLRQQIGAAKVVLMGHAWGGYCALSYALRYPERVDALILLAPIPSFPRMVQAAQQVLVGQVSGQESELALQVRELSGRNIDAYADLEALLRLLERTKAYGSNLDAAQDVLSQAYAYYKKIALLPEGLPLNNEEILPVLVARDGLLRYDLLAELAPGGYPTLLLSGGMDHVISRDLLDGLRQKLGAEFREIPGAGHYLYLDNPNVTLAEIISFLEAHP